jgi:hypothetical protein
MADQFSRPSFTQGAWIIGEPWKGLNYELFAGDGLNTLAVPTGKIDPHLVYSGTVWWKPLGTYGIPGTRVRSMYDDYQGQKKPLVRFGASFTKSKENGFSSTAAGNPENNGLFNSDGVNTFATGAFAPGVTVTDVTYRMLAVDWGVKWRGLAVNGQYFLRWLNNFRADGPIPISETFDHGFETEVSQLSFRRSGNCMAAHRSSSANSAILMSTLLASSGTLSTTTASGSSERVCALSSPLLQGSLDPTTQVSQVGHQCFS